MTDIRQIKCLFDGCNGIQGPEALEIKHKGELVGYICDNCQRGPKGFRISLESQDSVFRPYMAIPLNSIRK